MDDRGSMIDRHRLADSLRLRLSADEVEDLCFHLSVDYEQLALGSKSTKIRELIVYLERRDRLDELVAVLSERYPHALLNLQQVLESASATDERMRSNVQKLLGTFRIYYETLYEWKELHNHLDEITNIFGQYSAQVERFGLIAEPVDIEVLRISWRPVDNRMDLLMNWAADDINHIGDRYEVLPSGDQTGVEWAIELQQLRQAIKGYLHDDLVLGSHIPAKRGPFNRMLNTLGANKEEDEAWQSWWRSMTELTRQLDNTIRRHMFLADKELRKTAADLFDLSKEALWR